MHHHTHCRCWPSPRSTWYFGWLRLQGLGPWSEGHRLKACPWIPSSLGSVLEWLWVCISKMSRYFNLEDRDMYHSHSGPPLPLPGWYSRRVHRLSCIARWTWPQWRSWPPWRQSTKHLTQSRDRWSSRGRRDRWKWWWPSWPCPSWQEGGRGWRGGCCRRHWSGIASMKHPPAPQPCRPCWTHSVNHRPARTVARGK